jgi:hypothetical protein
MDKRTQGAWLLAHSKNLDHVSGPGALRLETSATPGRSAGYTTCFAVAATRRGRL